MLASSPSVSSPKCDSLFLAERRPLFLQAELDKKIDQAVRHVYDPLNGLLGLV